MQKKNVTFVIIGIFCAIVCPLTWAALEDLGQKSLDEFSQGFQGLVESTARLEEENNQQQQLNEGLKRKVDALIKSIGQSTLNGDQLQKKLGELNEITKGKSEQIKQIDNIVRKFQDDIKKVEQEIALSKIDLAERQKQQSYLLQILALAREKGAVHLDMKSVLENQEVLKQKVSYGNKRVEELEQEWKDLSFWYGDPNLSLPRLAVIKKQIQDKILEYQKLRVSDQWGQDNMEIKNSEQEIKELVFRHDLYKDMLKALDNQFTGEVRSKESVQEQKKLEINLSRLKKENKQLQEKVQDLRHEMVNFDKQKADLEKKMN